MESQDSLRQTLKYFEQQLQKKLDELQPMVQTIRQLEQELEVEAEDSAILNLPIFTAGLNTERNTYANSKRLDIRPDEYFTKSHGEAARDYLTRVGHAVALDELLDVLRMGGCKVGGIDPKRTLSVALLRNNWQDFVSVGNGYIGLRSFYGNAKSSGSKTTAKNKPKVKQSRNGRVTAKVKAVKPKKKQTSKLKPRNVPERKRIVVPEDVKQPELSPVRVAIREFMQDGELHTADSIIQAMSEKLGQAVKPISIHGTLRNGKEFEKVGNQYKLVA